MADTSGGQEVLDDILASTRLWPRWFAGSPTAIPTVRLLWLPFCMNMHEQLSSYKPSKHANTRAAKKIAQKLQEMSFFSYQHNLYGVLAVIPKNLFSPSELEPSSDIYKMRPKNKRINNSFKIITLWTYIKYNKIFHKYEYIFVKRYIIETSLAKKV